MLEAIEMSVIGKISSQTINRRTHLFRVADTKRLDNGVAQADIGAVQEEIELHLWQFIKVPAPTSVRLRPRSCRRASPSLRADRGRSY